MTQLALFGEPDEPEDDKPLVQRQAEGLARKIEGMSIVSRKTDPAWTERAHQVFDEVLEAYGEASSQDVRQDIGLPVDCEGVVLPNGMGAFTNSVKARYRKMGTPLVVAHLESSRWPDQHARPVPVYRRAT